MSKQPRQPTVRQSSVVDVPPDIEAGADKHASAKAVAAREGADAGTSADALDRIDEG